MTSTTGEVTGGEWRITPTDTGPYELRPPGTDEALMTCYPADDYRITVHESESHDIFEWHILLQRMITLINAARVGDQTKERRLVDDGDFSDTVCNSCGRAPGEYVPWGTRHTCGGMWMPAKKNPAR